MANPQSRSLGPELSAAEKTAGFCYLPIYLIILPYFLNWASETLGFHWSPVQRNLAFFVINCAAVWIIFHNFLFRSFRKIRFWELVQAVILGMALYLAGNYVVSLLNGLLHLGIPRFNDDTVAALAGENWYIMAFCGVLLGPLTEEVLVRGLVFGVLHRVHRILGYVISIVFFSLIHVYSYLGTLPLYEILLGAVAYIPAGIALGWTYEKANTVWAPVLLHMAVNAMAFGFLKLTF